MIYCRVSTKEQVDEGNSLVSQERLCREYALKEGFEIAEVFIEKGESAKTANRTQLNLLLKFCTKKKGSVQAVIAYKVDRISRSIADYTVIRATLKRYGVEIRSVTEFFEDTPAGRFMENIIANVGQFDNDVRAERSIGGMKEATEEGRYVWMAPIGYSNVKINNLSNIAPNRYAPLIKKAFEMIGLRKYSTNEIRLILAEEGLTNRRNNPVTCSNFFHLLRNPLYKGVIRKFGKEYQGRFDAIVSIELFDKVQAILKGRKNIVSQYLHENPDFPLRKFVSNEQGITMTGYWSKGKRLKYPYYSFKLPNTTIRREVLENQFKDFLKTFAFETRHLTRMRYHLSQQFEKKMRQESREKNKLQAQIDILNKQIDNLISLKVNGSISTTTFSLRVENFEAEIEKLKELLKVEVSHVFDVEGLMTFANKALKEPDKLWSVSSPKRKLNLQVFDFPNGVIYDGLKFKTPKTCNVFKVKNDIDLENCLQSPQSKRNKTPSSGEISIDPIKTREYWVLVAEEILKLKNIVENEETV